jgi:hypothetical protein
MLQGAVEAVKQRHALSPSSGAEKDNTGGAQSAGGSSSARLGALHQTSEGNHKPQTLSPLRRGPLTSITGSVVVAHWGSKEPRFLLTVASVQWPIR